MMRMVCTTALICLIFCSGCKKEGKHATMMDVPVTIDIKMLKNHVRYLSGIKPARNFLNQQSLAKASAYIEKEFLSYNFAIQKQAYDVKGRSFHNLIASYNVEKTERLIIGAHYDVHGESPGADDNASGIAGLLECARQLSIHTPQLDYRIDLVAYTLEEPPFFGTQNMGSARHAQKMKEENVTVKAMICLEMLGYYTDEENSQRYPLPGLDKIYPDTGHFITVVGRMKDNELINFVAQKIEESSPVPVVRFKGPKQMVGIDFSDHRNYWEQDFDAIMITDTAFYRNPHYHQLSDTFATLDFDKMTEVVKGIYWTIINFEKE